MLKLKVLPVGEYQANCYVLIASGEEDVLLFDPGGDSEKILEWVAPLRVDQILLTHGHPDHVGGLAAVRRVTGAPVGIHPLDAEAFDLQTDFTFQGGTEIHFHGAVLKVVHIPGHTSGSVAFRIEDGHVPPRALVGDAIFPGGPGHTSSPEALAKSIDSLAETVFTWPDSTLLYPGHGEPTSVGAEREAFEAFRSEPLPLDLYGDVNWR
jgi:glyoxylase-like metal-dependent hydrolase (beta-lactamase superfamily II)